MSDDLTDDAVKLTYRRYFEGKPHRIAGLEVARRQGRLGAEFYDLRESLKLTREQLAERAGVKPEDVESIEESDFIVVTADALYQVARALGKTLTTQLEPLPPEAISQDSDIPSHADANAK